MTVARRFAADRRRAFLWWSLGVVLTVGLTVAVWPSVRAQAQLEELMRDLPPAVQALFGAQEGIPFTSPAGYLHGRLFSSLLPVLLLVFGITVLPVALGPALAAAGAWCFANATCACPETTSNSQVPGRPRA